MPELPEVEVVRSGLAPAVIDSTIEKVEVFEPRSLRRHLGDTSDFIYRLEGAKIAEAMRRGKFLWFPLLDSSGEFTEQALVAHLGMSGQLLLRGPDFPQPEKLLRIRLSLNSPIHGRVFVNFVDQRIFGSLAIDNLLALEQRAGLAQNPDSSWGSYIPNSVNHIARDPLDEFFDFELFYSKLSRKNTEIKRALLDQNLISGIGNIYADEALWGAKIHYRTKASQLSREQVVELVDQIRLVLRKALAEGGTSFDHQYLNVNGEAGYFAHSLNAYGQHGKACPRCGKLVIREKFMNRSSHFCPNCQQWH